MASNMSESGFVDYYELLQISPNAEPETVHRVFKMLAQRYHPDNPETGDTERFVLSFPLWSIALLSLSLAASEKSVGVAQ